MKIYVGNLSFDAIKEDLRKNFESFGHVESVTIIKNRFSGRSKGFGFVEMADSTEAQAAISGLNDMELRGRTLRVNEAHFRPAGLRSDKSF